MPQRSLRLRLIFTFTTGAILIVVLLASLIFFGARQTLTRAQLSIDRGQAYDNAALLRTTLASNPLALSSEVAALEKSTNASVYLSAHGQWLEPTSTIPTLLISTPIATIAAAGQAASQIVSTPSGVVYVVAVPIPAVDTVVYHVFMLSGLQQSLQKLLVLLVVGGGLSVIVGFLGALFASLRTVRPLRSVAVAAEEILAGNLQARIPATNSGSEVRQLTTSFNAMVSQLASRIERDARFASDVAHELRTPLTGLTLAVSMLQREEQNLTRGGAKHLDVLSGDLAIFSNLVEDLLEMSQYDAGSHPLSLDEVPLVTLLERCVLASTDRLASTPLAIDIDASAQDVRVKVDRRRFERVIANLFDNAKKYANGVIAVRVECHDRRAFIFVDDDGPGVPVEERVAIFERFYRGPAANNRGQVQGTGLGLSLARDHVNAIGASLSVMDRPGGGARFVIELPVQEGVA